MDCDIVADKQSCRDCPFLRQHGCLIKAGRGCEYDFETVLKQEQHPAVHREEN